MPEFNREELRKIFKGAEIDVPKDVLGQICDLHMDASDGMADTVKDLKKQLKTAEKERDDAVAKLPKEGEETVSKADYDKLQNELDTLKNENAAKETKAAKTAAAKAYFEGKDIKDKNLTVALMAAAGVIDGLELDGDKFKDTKALDDLVADQFSNMVTPTVQKGAKTPNPHINNGGGKMSREDIAKIKDPMERQAAIAANMDQFEKG